MSKEIVKKIWPEWELDDKPLGSGSYGTVYRAVRRDNGVESTAAIKVISVPLNTSEIDSLRSEGLDENATRTHLKNVVDDYVREIKLMESMKGMQNIVSIEDYKVIEKEDEIGWYILIRMELLTPLNTYLCDKTFSETEAIKLGIDICSALEICAKSNIIHRDIKPENIFVNAYGYFKLGDFGIAKQFESMTGSLSQNRGTYYYMAPEVAKGTDYDVRADIYSLGIVLYRLLNKNHLPFLETEKQLTNPLEREKAVNRRINGEPLPPPSEASPATADLILWACEPDPANRISSAAEFKKLLINAGNGNYVPRNKDFNATVSVRRAPDVLNGTVTVRRAEPAQKTDEVGTFGQKPKKKGIGLIIAVIALLVVLIAVGAFFGISALKENDSKSGTIGNPVTDSDVQPEEETTDDVNAPDTQNGKESENNAVYSDADEEKIQAILTEAEQLTALEDYENACAKISVGLVTYPKSEELKAKSEEYGELLAKQVKEKTLAEADALADAGSYEEAIAVIEEAQKDSSSDSDYIAAIEKYNTERLETIKRDAISEADEYISSQDYLEAIDVINKALEVMPNDTVLSDKVSECENNYIAEISEQVDKYLEKEDFDSAEKVVAEAKNHIPNNPEIANQQKRINESKPCNLLDVCEPYQTSEYNTPATFEMAGKVYSNGFTLACHGGSALFNLEGKYNRLEFDLGYKDSLDRASCNVNIYLDGQLVKNIVMDYEDLPQHIEIPLNGAVQLKIENVNYGNMAVYGFADVIVHKAPNGNSKNESTETEPNNSQYLLSVCEPYQTSEYNTPATFEMAGKVYSNGFTLACHGGSALFNLEGKYNRLEFDLGYKDSLDRASCNVNIYLDGQLVKNIVMDYEDLPQHIEIPLNGAVQLKIENVNYGNMAVYGFANVTVE